MKRMGCTRHFLDPTRPALDLAAAFLEEGWENGPLDLRTTLIVVPTRHAGRRLRERLALDAAQRGTAVLSGPVFTPARLFQPAPIDPRPVASGVVAQALWIETLRSAPPEIRLLLKPEASNAAPPQFAFKAVAQHLVSLRETLCEEGYSIASFVDRLRAEHLEFEPDRWEAIAQLEAAYVRLAEQQGYRDDVTEKLRAANAPSLPEGILRVVIMFVPDPPPLSLKALAMAAQTIPVHVCIHADETDGSAFDAWGRPLAHVWIDRVLPTVLSQIEVCDDPLAMAERVRELVLAMSPDQRFSTTIGTADALHGEIIESTLAREGLSIFNPAGRAALRLPLCTFLSRLFDFRRERSFHALLELARHPYAERRLKRIAKTTSLLSDLDDFQNEHFPWSCESARDIATRCASGTDSGRADATRSALTTLAVLDEIHTWLQPFDKSGAERPTLSAVLPLVLRIVFEDQEADEQLKTAADLLREALDDLRAVEPLCENLDEQCNWLLDILGQKVEHPVRTADAIELLGWLELAWEDAPILILTDMNDGLVPETVPPHPFLPDNMRRASGLRDNDHRLARDAYVLEGLVRSRRPENVRFLVPRRSADGHPLKPSRLLLQCAPEDIAQRALHLFSDHAPASVLVQRSPGLRPKPPLPPQPCPLPDLSITALRDYLSDPFVFYLRHVLKIGEPFKEAFELDAITFGSLCHIILAAFGTSDVRDSANEDDIRDFLEQQTTREFERRFGSSPAAPLVLQRDLILRRMRAFAKVQARIRNEGWQIVACERSISLEVEGTRLHGRIDRIDRHAETGCFRIIDYKTSREAEAPAKAHRTATKEPSKALPFALSRDRSYYWIDLQLPLYAFAWRQQQSGEQPVSVAYFALPDDTRETDLLEWQGGLQETDLDEALHCAQRIVRRARAGVFWPPSSGRRQDDVLWPLFFNDTEYHLDAGFVEEMSKRAAEYDEAAQAGGGP